jgi:L-ectoine synthase
MIVQSKAGYQGSERDVDWGNGTSVRLLVEGEGRPFTVTHTTVNPGSSSDLCYERHFEACYCVAGEGAVVIDGESHRLEPGVIYCPGKGEKHSLQATTELHLVCVFSPPLEGTEHHSLNGDGHSSY